MTRVRRCATFLMLSAACLGGCHGADAGESIALHPCVSWPLLEIARCGRLTVPEARNTPSSLAISLGVLVLRARIQRTSAVPVVFLDGGPGLPATGDAAYADWALNELRADRDVVMLDMRGTGDAPSLHCHLYDDGGRLAPYLERMFPIARVRDCAERLATHQRVDLTRYTTIAAAEDLEALRVALGVRQLDLFGASYGTRLALTYVRRYPGRVRRAVLLGVVPPEAPLIGSFVRGTAAAFDSAYAACASDVVCASDAPNARRDVDSLLAELRRRPAVVALWNARRLRFERVTLTAPALAELLWTESYAPASLVSILPLVHAVRRTGDLRPLAHRLLTDARRRRDGRAEGLMLSVICAEDVPRLDPSAAGDSTAPGGVVVADLVAACSVWPHAAPDPAFAQPITSEVPTLMLSGGRDPVSPPDLAALASRSLPRSTHRVDGSAGHAMLRDADRRAIADFLMSP